MKNKQLKQILVLIAGMSSMYSVSANDMKSCMNQDYNVIHLIGEDHYDEECIKFKDQLTRDAENDKVILALEGRPFNNLEESRIFGIEEGYTHALGWAWSYYNAIALYRIIQNISSLNDANAVPIINGFKSLFEMIFTSPSLCLKNMHAILDFMDEDLKLISSKNKKIVSEFLKLNRLKSSLAYEKKVVQLTKNHSFAKPFFLHMHNDISQWIELFKEVIDLIAEKAIRENEQLSFNTINQVRSNVRQVEEYLTMNAKQQHNAIVLIVEDFVKFYTLKETIDIDHRNSVFLKNIISIFEDVQLREKPFYVVIGTMHIPFLYEELKRQGYQVDMNEMGQKYYEDYLAQKKMSDKQEL